MRTLRTPRLRLNPVTAQNALALWRLLQQPDLRRFQDLPNVGAALFAEMVGKRPRRLTPTACGRFEWLIHIVGERPPVGWVSLRIAERDPNTGELGYSIVREQRGRGIATEAVRMLMDEAFDIARLARVRAYCMPENRASRRVLAAVGFRDDGVLAHGATVSGRTVDVNAYTLDRQGWYEARPGVSDRAEIQS